MILKEIRPINWGPFRASETLTVEPDTTALTAANDAGKSSLLRLINCAYLFLGNNQVHKEDLNIDHHTSSKYSNWARDTSFGCKLTFIARDNASRYISTPAGNQKIESGDKVELRFNFSPDDKNYTIGVYRAGKKVNFDYGLSFNKMPRVIRLPTEERISSVINLSNPSELEKLFLRAAFGYDFDPIKIINLSRPLYTAQLRQAKVRLNQSISRVVPDPLQMSFYLEQGESREEIVILPYDQEYGSAPLSSRGTGIHTLLSLLVSLLDVEDDGEQIIILLDEPENSLHADAQHLLRKLLEDLAREDRIQVIYATHSPAMINNMRPRSVRLLKRVLSGESVVTEINNRPIDNNFLQIRSTLGMSPSDSLQFAPVTIVVEGPSEAIGMQLMLEKLHSLNAPGFEDVPLLTPQCHIVDGVGDNYFRQAKFALSQNSQVVVFLDGDKQVQQDIVDALPSVPIIKLQNKEEIEQLVPGEIYFRALLEDMAEQHITPVGPIDQVGLDNWLDGKPPKILNKAFSKKVEFWLDDVVPEFEFVKPRVLRKAIDLVNSADHIRTDELRQLVQEILERLPSTS